MVWLRLLNGITRRLWLLAAALIIAYAVLVSLGRQLLPEVDRYKPEITGYLSEQLGVNLQIQSLDGYWLRTTPQLLANGIAIYPSGESEAAAIKVDRLRIEPDMVASLGNRTLVWRDLELDNLDLTAVEDEQGRWSVGGIPLEAGDSENLSGLVEVATRSGYIRIDRVALTLEFFSGTTATVYARNILLENSGDFHRLQAGLALEAPQADAAELVLEFAGNPSDPGDFQGLGYLRLSRINFSGALSTIARGLFPRLVERMGDIDTHIDGELWLTGSASGGAELVGEVAAAEVPLDWTQDVAPLKNLAARVTGWWRPGEDWGLRLQDLDFEWQGEQITPLNAVFSQGVGGRWGEYRLAVDHLNLETLRQLLRKTGLVEQGLAKTLATLAPSGDVENLSLHLDYGADHPEVRIEGNLINLNIDSVKGAPASQGINGYFAVDGTAGFLEIDSPDGIAMLYPKAYDDWMRHDSLRGRVDWRLDREASAVKVYSGPLEIGGEQGRAMARLYLNLPVAGAEGDPEMYLTVGMQDSHSRFRNQFIPKVLDPKLLNWLETSVGDGEITESGFIWRGSLKKGHSDRRAVQLFVKVRGAELKYHPEWPGLEGMDATIIVDNGDLDGVIERGSVGGAKIEGAEVTLRRRGGGRLLKVVGRLRADGGEALDILADSPLRARVAMMENWRLSGETGIDLDLRIPFGAGVSGEDYRVAAHLDNATLSHRGSEFQIDGISGTLRYDRHNNLFADSLAATIYDSPIEAKVSTREGMTEIVASGRFDAVALAGFSSRLQERFRGAIEARAVLSIPFAADGGETGAPRLTLESDLAGLEIRLPEPFAKTADERIATDATMAFLDGGSRISFSVGNTFRGDMLFEGAQLDRGVLRIGEGEVNLPEEPGLLLQGLFGEVYTADWQPVLAGGGGEVDLTGLKPRVQFYFDHLKVGDISLKQARLTGSLTGEAWDLEMHSDLLAGGVQLPADDSLPTVLRLDYLRLPAPDPQDESRLLDDLDPRRLPALDFATQSLSLGDREYGSLAFVSEPLEDGIRISNIEGNITGFRIGAKENTEPTVLQWQVGDGGHRTIVTGLFQSRDLGGVLESWQIPRTVDSEYAAFYADLRWNGKPWEMEARNLNGYLGIDLNNGRFYKAPGGATNALIKTVSLFNFDTWLRRLRFDFTDLLSKGVSFDRLNGGLAFSNGIMLFDDPIVTDMPSGKMRLLGKADLLQEKLDARLVATLPVGTNLPWMAALVGGLPAAAGVYLTGKVFEKQVDKLSSISYKVTGSWDDPRLEVDRIFSDKTDLEED